MNIFSHLANVLKPAVDGDAELSAEEIEARDKADRIKFHRESVRNGPVKFKDVTNGQIRRAKVRAEERQRRKQFKSDVRSYFERQRVAAVLRPHLQTIGVLPFYDGHEAPLDQQITSTAWICQRYGNEVKVDGQGTGHVSFLRDDVVSAIETAAAFYRAATGDERAKADKSFQPAIYVDEEQAVEVAS